MKQENKPAQVTAQAGYGGDNHLSPDAYNVTHFHTLFKASDVARLLNISRTSAYRIMREGCLPVVKLGPGIVRVRLADLEAYIERSMQGGSYDNNG